MKELTLIGGDSVTELAELKGAIIERIDVVKDVVGMPDSMTFHLTTGDSYMMFHEQDCCESVHIEDIEGDIADLFFSTILIAEEVARKGNQISGDSETWTFYRIATEKGWVIVRWYGVSNGYYSESVGLYKLEAGGRLPLLS